MIFIYHINNFAFTCTARAANGAEPWLDGDVRNGGMDTGMDKWALSQKTKLVPGSVFCPCHPNLEHFHPSRLFQGHVKGQGQAIGKVVLVLWVN